MAKRQPTKSDGLGMSWTDLLGLAFRSLIGNRLRTILLALSIVVGIAANILLTNLVIGARLLVAEEVYGLGANTFQVTKSPVLITSLKEYVATLHRQELTLENYYEVSRNCVHCQVVGAVCTHQAGIITFGRQVISNTEVRGWTPSVQDIYNLDVLLGRPFVDLDMARRDQVALIGYSLYSSLFASLDPLHQEIRIDGTPYHVIGVGQKEGSYLSKDRDNWVAIPLSTWRAKYGVHQPLMIWVKTVDAGEGLETAMDEVRTTLRSSRHQSSEGDDSFEISTNASVTSLWTNLSGGFFLALIVITSLSLLTAGIMIMNTMLISVIERTREIGLCKAIGASNTNIFCQFLAEAVALSLTGCLFGVATGQAFWQGLAYLTVFPAQFSVWPILIAVGVATGAGILFGVLPAYKAASLDPAEALRSEA